MYSRVVLIYRGEKKILNKFYIDTLYSKLSAVRFGGFKTRTFGTLTVGIYNCTQISKNFF